MGEDSAVSLFREYLKIKTVQPDVDYSKSVEFLQRVAEDVGLQFKSFEVAPKKPICIMTWEGLEPSLPSILLSSHIDVVPVFSEHWRVDPFSAEKIDGNIYARGSQDMKCVSIQYIEAIRRIKSSGKRLLRTLHLVFTSDEEIGSTPQSLFVHHDEFKKLNVGFALDEGIANPGEEFRVFYGERSIWWVQVKCQGQPGHGSQFIENTAAQKIQKVINSFLSFRDQQEKRLKGDKSLSLGHVTTVNMTMLDGGIQFNVVPAELSVGFDIRVAPDVDFDEFEKQIAAWCHQAGSDVSYSFVVKGCHQELTSIDENDPWWSAFHQACLNMDLKIQTEIFPAGTDSRFIRKCGIPAIGFSPMNHTPILLHDHNEYLNEDIFLRGIEIYQEIIPTLANVQRF
ncbi:aminoacylase-1 isoform X1 [Patella vulgata]|uniref:aminoacylase-1 isoform X1 n=2 Tax=Patella vulgata TaxID=6465 RepID=UPI0024A9CD69|nr:aminoacylase-1 isoform X1 [Patella vulgata]